MNNLAYYRARQRGVDPGDAADEAGGRDPLDFASDPSVSADDVTPPDDSTPDSTDVAPPSPAVQTSAPPAPPAPEPTAPLLTAAPTLSDRLSEALQRARARPARPADINDDALTQSMQNDEQSAAKDKLTESIRAAFARQSPNFSNVSSGPSAATRALQLKRQSFDQNAGADRAEALAEAKLLKPAGSDKGVMTEYQRYEVKRNDQLDADKRSAAEKKATETQGALETSRKAYAPILQALGVDPETASQKDIDRAISVKHAAATEHLAEATFSENKQQHIDQQAHELSKELGDPAVFDSQYRRVQELIAANGGRVPGAGKLEALKQDSALSPVLSGLSSDDAVEGRKLVKQLANNYVHAITGAGVSNTERAQLQSASVNVDSSDDRQIVLGLKTLKDMYDAKVKSAKAGYRPEAVHRVEGAQSPPPPPLHASSPKGLPPGAIQKKGEAGTWLVPTADGWYEWKAGK